MIDSHSWRDLLRKIISDTQKRQRIVKVLGVSNMTLARWVNGESRPRFTNLRALLSELPEYRDALLDLLAEEFGEDLVEALDTETQPQEIPSSFYTKIMQLHSTLPRVTHCSSICETILQQALRQLDPNRSDIFLSILRCLPPLSDHKVRCLWEYRSCGAALWNSASTPWAFLCGKGSLTGLAVATQKTVLVEQSTGNSCFDNTWRVAWHNCEPSAIACPILLNGNISGCLAVFSQQPEFFLPLRCALIQQYADLLTIAFEDNDFFTPDAIDLQEIPAYEKQAVIWQSLWLRRLQEQEPEGVNLLHIEQCMFQQLETALLGP